MTNRRMDEIVRNQRPVMLRADATVRDACVRMHEHKIGAILVTDAAGLSAYVLLEALIFLPILYVAQSYFADQNLIAKAGLMTMGVFGGLTATVFVTKKDFSFLGPVICVASFCALGLILCSILFGLNLGTFFSFAMVALASAFILYDTSNVLHRYRTDQYVGASLELFASVATLFYYILRILMSSSSRD